MSKIASFWLGMALAASIAAPAAAQQAASAPPDAARVRELVQQALQQTQPQAQSPAGAPTQVFVTGGPRVNLAIEEAVKLGADKNIDIAVARITPQLTDFTIAGLEANYRLNLTSSTSNTKQHDGCRNLTTQGISEPTTSVRETWSAGLAQNLWRGGGSYNVNWTNGRLNNQSTVNLRNPQFTSGITGAITQPLWRGFKIDATRASILTSRLSQQNDEITLTSTVTSTQANVRNAYWDLVFAIQAVEAAQNSFDLAARLVQDNQSRVEIGTLAPIDVVTAQAEQATRRQTLVLSQATVRTSELALKRLIVSGTDDPLWTSSINPVDRPSTTPEPINLEAAVTRALAGRTDLQQSKNNLKISDINLQNQVDATKPAVEPDGELRPERTRWASVRLHRRPRPDYRRAPEHHDSLRVCRCPAQHRRDWMRPSGPSASTSRIRWAGARRKQRSTARNSRCGRPKPT